MHWSDMCLKIWQLDIFLLCADKMHAMTTKNISTICIRGFKLHCRGYEFPKRIFHLLRSTIVHEL